ncbi:putative peptide/nitrate transporter [Apostasia shenzhenica]|uniref:Putative peptide/nitrate transporter n=1 Tax=Apostasia shenzhenica TaxID=1088818 RepID=A0A2I0BDJ2_9ASPA|nr:putative peptide/nitrate transporter [Apostasia shenzhenica]
MASVKNPSSSSSRRGLSKPCVLVILVASVERFAYKGVSSNLVTYLAGGDVGMSPAAAAKAVSGWNGVTSMLPLVTSVLVDSYWDRYSTIISSSLVYITGLVGLTSWAFLDRWMPTYTLFLPLYLISIGQSGYNPSLQAFGAEQLEVEDDLINFVKEEDHEAKQKSFFFQWWYFGICAGSLLGNSVMSYVQDNIGWGLGFSIPAAAMAVSVACFSASSRLYRRKGKGFRRKLPLEEVSRSAKASLLKIFARKISLPSRDNEEDEDDSRVFELQQKPFQETFETCTAAASVKLPDIAGVIMKLIPIWTMLLTFAVIFQQPSTFFTDQGAAMNHYIGPTFLLPPAMLQSAITVSIVTLMPLYDKLIVPLARPLTGHDRGITVLQRIGVGMLLSIAAMAVAASVEMKRIHTPREDGMLSIFWLLPQYILLGISDVFTVVGMQEFFYGRVPKAMRTVGIGLYLSVFGVGSFASAGLVAVAERLGWFSGDMREAELYKYYWLLACLASLSFIVFVILCRYYRDEGAIGCADAENGGGEF